MPVRKTGGVFNEQVLTGSLAHYAICGADFSGAINSYGQPVPNSAAEIIFTKISEGAYINIMNPNDCNLSFALEAGRSIWDEISLTVMVQSLGPNVGVDHIDCTLCTVKQVPYIWGCGTGSADAFSFVASPSQPTISASANDTLTLIAGTNMVITTNMLLKTVTFDSLGVQGPYIPVPPATALLANTRYYITSPGTVTLPLGSGTLITGTFVKVTKKPGDTIFINTVGPDSIATDLGNDISIEVDATQECVFIFDGVSSWDLQVGSVN